jgi:hypothetical protein
MEIEKLLTLDNGIRKAENVYSVLKINKTEL